MTGKGRVTAGERPLTVTGDPQLRAGQADGLLRILGIDPATGGALPRPPDGDRADETATARARSRRRSGHRHRTR